MAPMGVAAAAGSSRAAGQVATPTGVAAATAAAGSSRAAGQGAAPIMVARATARRLTRQQPTSIAGSLHIFSPAAAPGHPSQMPSAGMHRLHLPAAPTPTAAVLTTTVQQATHPSARGCAVAPTGAVMPPGCSAASYSVQVQRLTYGNENEADGGLPNKRHHADNTCVRSMLADSTNM